LLLLFAEDLALRDRQPSVGLVTVGCKLNQYETEGLAERLEESGFNVVPFASTADVYVINTCTVTARSDYKSRQMIRRASRRNPQALVVATGCYAEREPGTLSGMPEVGLVVGNASKSSLPELVRVRLSGTFGLLRAAPAPPASEFGFFDITGFRDYTRAFVKIQDGCDRRCTYCAVPDARGPARSRPFDDVVRQVALLGDRGYREIVLTGVHIGAYSDERGRRLSDLIEALIGVESVDRLRLGSVEPRELTPALAEIILTSPKVCNHLHVPLESGSDAVLGRMGRGYTRDAYREAVASVTARDALCGLGADVMVGFPGETEEDFADTVTLIESLPFTYLHVFCYSPREGTRAAAMSGRVPNDEAAERSKLLRRLGKRLSLGFRRRLSGETLDVLVEGRSGLPQGRVSGLAPNYVRVLTDGDATLHNRIVSVRIRGADASSTWGDRVPGSSR
jgi:threonylcarbamoyladenosine tRNA methylthiotransferase MtaB